MTNTVYARSLSSVVHPLRWLLIGVWAVTGFFIGGITGSLIQVVWNIESAGVPLVAATGQFTGFLLGIFAGWKVYIPRPIGSFFSVYGRFRWKVCIRWALVWGGILLLIDVLFFVGNLMITGTHSHTFQPENIWDLLRILPIFLIFFVIQTGAEEYVFRGWLHQFFGFFHHVPLWLGYAVSSALFALLHSSNPEAAEYGAVYFILLFGLGVLLSYVTHISAGIEAAWGVHYANNLYAFAVVSYPSAVIIPPSLFQVSAQAVVATTGLSIVCGLCAVILYNTWSMSRCNAKPKTLQNGELQADAW